MTLETEASIRGKLTSISGAAGIALVLVMLSGPPLMALTFSAIAPALPMIADHFRHSAGGTLLAQWIMTMPAIGLMLGGPMGGWLIDRIGPRRLLLAALAGFAIGGSTGLWTSSAVLLLIGRFVLGFCGASIAIATTWLISVRHEEKSRRRLIATQDAAAGVAAMSAVLLSGLAAAYAGWRAPFAIYLVALPLLILAAFVVPQFRVPAIGSGGQKLSIKDIHPLWPIYAIIVALAGMMLLPSTQVPFLLQSNGVVDPVVRSRVIATSAFFTILSAACFPLVRARLSEAGILRAILCAYVAATITLMLSRGPLGAAVGCALLGLGTGLFGPFFATLLSSRSSPALRGRALGLMFGAIFLSEFLSPLIILPLRAMFGVTDSFGALAALLTCGLVASILRPPFQPKSQPTTARPST